MRSFDPKAVDMERVIASLSLSWNVTNDQLNDLAESGQFYLPEKPDDISPAEWVRRSAVASTYGESPNDIRDLIRNDPHGQDVVAITRRRDSVAKFRRLLTDDDYFNQQRPNNRGQEIVWQSFFEENSWIFGGALSVQFLAAFDPRRLEQTVVGSSVSGPGKRTDALMRTAGRVRSLVFVEIKHHRTELLGDEYRSGCWAPSEDLSGGVAQIQGTVYRTVADIGVRLQEQASDGSDIPGQFSYLVHPRSYLIIGSLDEFYGQAEGLNVDKYQSFELYRRNIREPEIVTFDELLSRAEGLIDMSNA